MTLRIVRSEAGGEEGIPLPLRIDLENLAGADGAGLQALHRERRRGARLAGASPYIALLLERADHHPGDEA